MSFRIRPIAAINHFIGFVLIGLTSSSIILILVLYKQLAQENLNRISE